MLTTVLNLPNLLSIMASNTTEITLHYNPHKQESIFIPFSVVPILLSPCTFQDPGKHKPSQALNSRKSSWIPFPKWNSNFNQLGKKKLRAHHVFLMNATHLWTVRE